VIEAPERAGKAGASSGRPASRFSNGTAKRRPLTTAANGFPGRSRIRVCFRRPYAIDRPGFSESWRLVTLPPIIATAFEVRSVSLFVAPPVEIRMSKDPETEIAREISPRQSGTIPRSITVAAEGSKATATVRDSRRQSCPLRRVHRARRVRLRWTVNQR
jgi:hypothetical protein